MVANTKLVVDQTVCLGYVPQKDSLFEGGHKRVNYFFSVWLILERMQQQQLEWNALVEVDLLS